MMIRSTIKRVGYSDYCLEIKEDRLRGEPIVVFKGYYGSEGDAQKARDQCRLGLSMKESSVPICQESEKYSVLIRRDGFWTFGPYWEDEHFAMNVRLDEPRQDISEQDFFNGRSMYRVEHFRRVFLRNVVLYPITIYAVDPEELAHEHMDMLKTLIDRLRPNRKRGW